MQIFTETFSRGLIVKPTLALLPRHAIVPIVFPRRVRRWW